VTNSLSGDSDSGLVPSRGATRRARRRTTAAPAPVTDPTSAILAGIVAMQAAQESLAQEVRELRRRIDVLSGKLELLSAGTAGTPATPTRRRRASAE